MLLNVIALAFLALMASQLISPQSTFASPIDQCGGTGGPPYPIGVINCIPAYTQEELNRLLQEQGQAQTSQSPAAPASSIQPTSRTQQCWRDGTPCPIGVVDGVPAYTPEELNRLLQGQTQPRQRIESRQVVEKATVASASTSSRPPPPPPAAAGRESDGAACTSRSR